LGGGRGRIGGHGTSDTWRGEKKSQKAGVQRQKKKKRAKGIKVQSSGTAKDIRDKIGQDQGGGKTEEIKQ